MKNIPKKLIDRFGSLKSQRVNYDEVWQDQSEYVLPNRMDFTTKRSKGENRVNRQVFDTTAIHANQLLAATLHSGLTNASTEWFELSMSRRELETPEVMGFLEGAKDKVLEVFNSTDSDFQSQVHEFYLALTAFGTAAMYVEKDDKGKVRFTNVHLSELYIQDDKYGVIDTVFRKFTFTPRQAAQLFGKEKLSMKMQNDLKNMCCDDKKEFIHVVMPAEDVGEKDSRFPIKSYYIDVENEHIIQESGFFEMPYIVARFEKLAGETYGRSPAWSALPDIKMVNAMNKSIIRAAQLQSNPPLLLADDGVMMPLQAKPNGVIVGGLSLDGSQRVSPLDIGGRLNIGAELLSQKQTAVRDAFFIDRLLFREGTPVTATEALQRQEEKLRLLAPHLGRIQSEFLNPLIDRVFGILDRDNKLGPIPEILSGVKLDIEYKSPLIKLQKGNEIQSLGRFLQSILPLIQIDPQALDILNIDEVVRNVADASGMNITTIRTDDEIAAIRQQRAQQQQLAQTLEAGKQVSEIDKNLGG